MPLDLATALPSPVPPTWDLESLGPRPGTDDFAAKLSGIADRLAALDTQSESLPQPTTENAAAWGDFVIEMGEAFHEFGSLSSLVGCWAAGDAENETYQQIEAKLAAFSPVRTRISLAIEMAVRDLDADALGAFVEADDRLKANRFFLQQMAADGKLRLPRDLEAFAAELDVDGLQAWSRLYDRLSGELRVPIQERGRIVMKSPGQVSTDQVSRTERANNFHAAEAAWATIGDTCADALNHMAGTRLTKYARLGIDHLEKPLRLNRLRRETLDRMWACVNDRKGMLVRYFKEKAKWYDLEKLAIYDLFAPLPLRGATAKLSYDQACRTVVETLAEFSAPLGEFAAEAIAGRWVEAEDRAGKRQGGFCTDLSIQKQSRIFMTFTGSPDSMSTLAHELGHAYHTYVLRNEPLLLQEYPMNLAETASTFAEAVVNSRRLDDAASDAERLGVLNGMCADSVAFLMNIGSRFFFEDAFHKARANGELTAAQLSDLMLTAQKSAYENALADDGYYPEFWISKLHFYIDGWPFYNFPYTFGYLLSLGLFTLGRQQPDSFAGNFRDFLVLTGCRETEAAVAESFGHDLSQPDFWNLALDAIESHVDQFVTLSESLR